MQPQWIPVIVEFPITLGSLSAYTAEDVVGGGATGYLTTTAALPQIKGGGWIAWAKLIDDADQAEPFRIYVYDNVPSTIAEDAEFVPVEADWAKHLGCIEIEAADYDQSGADACAMVPGDDYKTGKEIIFNNLATGKLYLRLVAVDTPDYADADDLTLQLGLWVM